MQQIMTVTRVTFVEGGDTNVETGIKSHMSTRGMVIGGGHGTYVTTTPNRIFVEGKVDGETKKYEVLKTLRTALGLKRLTKQKRDRILSVHPQQISFNRESGYWVLNTESADQWLRLAKLK